MKSAPERPVSVTRKNVASILGRLVRIPGWASFRFVALAAQLNVNYRGLRTLVVSQPHLMAQRLEARAAAPGKLLARIRALPRWEMLTHLYLAEKLQCTLPAIAAAIRSDPAALALWQSHGRLRRQVLHPKENKHDFHRVPDWQHKTTQDIARGLGITRQRLSQLVMERPAWREELSARPGPPKTIYTAEYVLKAQAGCCTAEEASRAMGVAVETYRARALAAGVKTLPVESLLAIMEKEDLKPRMLKIRGWQTLSYADLAKRMGCSYYSLSKMLYLNPSLKLEKKRAMRKAILAACPAVAADTPDRKAVLALPDWRFLSVRKIARKLGVEEGHVTSFFRENEDLWNRRNACSKPSPVRSAIMAVPDWRKKTYAELANITGIAASSIERRIRLTPEMVAAHEYSQHLMSAQFLHFPRGRSSKSVALRLIKSPALAHRPVEEIATILQVSPAMVRTSMAGFPISARRLSAA